MRLIFFTIFFVFHCFALGRKTSSAEFSIMTYNVENLFDSKHDASHDDETFLPRSEKRSPEHISKCKKLANFKFRKDCLYLDWNQKIIEAKMKNISEVILSKDRGQGPDILILAEVENINILNQLNQKYLQAAHYKTVELIEGDDVRGIDVAVLSRFPEADTPKLFSLGMVNSSTGEKLRTRGVLLVPLKISGNQTLSVFAVHMPSQGNPIESRLQGVQSLNQILESEKNAWIVGGDFNITKKEEKEEHLVSEKLAKHGSISHFIGCKECRGTHFYKNKWAFLDIFYFDSRLPSLGYTVLNDSIEVVNSLYYRGVEKRPWRFDPAKGQGASDHFPLYARLRWEKQRL